MFYGTGLVNASLQVGGGNCICGNAAPRQCVHETSFAGSSRACACHVRSSCLSPAAALGAVLPLAAPSSPVCAAAICFPPRRLRPPCKIAVHAPGGSHCQEPPRSLQHRSAQCLAYSPALSSLVPPPSSLVPPRSYPLSRWYCIYDKWSLMGEEGCEEPREN